jgi:hypothetical protein
LTILDVRFPIIVDPILNRALWIRIDQVTTSGKDFPFQGGPKISIYDAVACSECPLRHCFFAIRDSQLLRASEDWRAVEEADGLRVYWDADHHSHYQQAACYEAQLRHNPH